MIRRRANGRFPAPTFGEYRLPPVAQSSRSADGADLARRRGRAHPAGSPEDPTSPAVCRAWPTCSSRAARRNRRSAGRAFTGVISSGGDQGQGAPADPDQDGKVSTRTGSRRGHPIVHEGQVVKGRADRRRRRPAGHPAPARRRGAGALASSTRKIQDVYRLQGVKINDKHIEVDRSPDAAPRVDHQPGRRTTSTASRSNVQSCSTPTTACCAEGKMPATGIGRCAAGHHQGFAVDRLRSSRRPSFQETTRC